jgi:anti-anti-sigma regulatory factor
VSVAPSTLLDRPRVHTLLVGESDGRRRAGVARWIDDELAVGAKVLYTGRLDPGSTVERHWIAGPDGPRGARAALSTGQLEFLDIEAMLEATGGAADALLTRRRGGVDAALDGGWGRIAMSAESPHRPMAEGEAEQLRRHEAGITDIVADAPVTVLCQLAVGEENHAAIAETVGAHHRDLVDDTWSAGEVDGAWVVAGELDAHVAHRFAAGLRGALADDVSRGGDPELHIDLGQVEFMDVACVQVVGLAARNLEGSPAARIVLHRPSRLVRRLVDAVGRPRTLLVAGGDPR